MLDPIKLRTLSEVARLGTIANAASALGCTASAASQQISSLERQLGAQLLERTSRSVKLTEAGRVLVERGEKALKELEFAERSALDVAHLRAGRVRVSTSSFAAALFVVPAMSRFSRRFPEVELSFTEIEPEFALDAVITGKTDLAIINQYRAMPAPNLKGLKQSLLRSEKLLLALPPHLHTSDTDPVSLKNYAESTWISTTIPEGYQALTEIVCRNAGFEPHIGFRADTYVLILELVSADFGPALVPEPVARTHSSIRYRNIAEPDNLVRDVYLVVRDGALAPPVEAMSQAIQTQLLRLSGASR